VQGRGDRLRQASDEEMNLGACGLRQGLRTRGFETSLVAESFALVREMANRHVGLRHYDAQITGGWVMTLGMLAEMETGEGKTLTATLPACTAALAGVPVHVVSVNDYLVTRDAEWMRPIYEGLGLTVGVITEDSDAQARRGAYRCDVTYCSNKQLAFDYLKDRLTLGQTTGPVRLQAEGFSREQPRVERALLRGLCYAIVDEADSVLVDEARTPLIISKPAGSDDEIRTYREALTIAEKLRSGVDYLVETRDRVVHLTESGTKCLDQLALPLGGLWRGRRRREELVKQALSAMHLFERDRHYLVRDSKVQIVDEFTGRTMADRSWERGLHQLIEAKEGLEISARKDTLARISYQRFFRRYLRLAGMSGTAREVAGEMWSVYRLKVVTVPPNRPLQRRRSGQQLFRRVEDKWRAVVDAIAELHREGRPVLVGTRSVSASEHLSAMLVEAGLVHRVLNARHDQQEAEIVEQAGQDAQITVATNMAGRGTDIKLGAGVKDKGGIHVLATEIHEAGRIDRQLWGSCGRQGDPGSYSVFMSLEDELFEVYCPVSVRRLAQWVAIGRLVSHVSPEAQTCRFGHVSPEAQTCGVSHVSPEAQTCGICDVLVSWLARLAQRAAERHHARVRQELLRGDERLGRAMAFAGQPE
ncbi:MAG: preprotein translocase subunit SecA, partial [Gammaproteobacteria bacterium]